MPATAHAPSLGSRDRQRLATRERLFGAALDEIRGDYGHHLRPWHGWRGGSPRVGSYDLLRQGGNRCSLPAVGSRAVTRMWLCPRPASDHYLPRSSHRPSRRY